MPSVLQLSGFIWERRGRVAAPSECECELPESAIITFAVLSERMQRRTDALLNEADQAVPEINTEDEDGSGFLRMALARVAPAARGAATSAGVATSMGITKIAAKYRAEAANPAGPTETEHGPGEWFADELAVELS
jgi:hypothetical protein